MPGNLRISAPLILKTRLQLVGRKTPCTSSNIGKFNVYMATKSTLTSKQNMLHLLRIVFVIVAYLEISFSCKGASDGLYFSHTL